jgi:hypothetical protein
MNHNGAFVNITWQEEQGVSVFLSQFPEEGEIMEHMVNNTFIMTQVL